MSDEKPVEATNPEDLTKTKKPSEIPLTEQDLKHISGGTALTNDADPGVRAA